MRLAKRFLNRTRVKILLAATFFSAGWCVCYYFDVNPSTVFGPDIIRKPIFGHLEGVRLC